MAKIFLDGTESYLVANNGSEVFGGTGANVITVAAGVTGVIFDQQVERIALNYATTDLAFKQSGNRIEVYTGGQMVMRAIVQQDTDGTLLTTTSGTMQVKVDATGMFVGGALVTATTTGSTATALTPTTVDTTITTGGAAGAASYSVTVGTSITEEGTAAAFTVTRTGDIAAAKTLSYNLTADASLVAGATPGVDTSIVSGTVTFTAGSSTATFSVTPTSDRVLEGLEGLKVTLIDPTSLRSVASTSVLIQDDSTPRFALTANAPTVVEGNAGTAALSFSVTLDAVPTTAVTASFATRTSGSADPSGDFVPTSGTVVFATGVRTATVTIPVIGDTVSEGDETVVVGFSGALISADVLATGVIVNDDGGSFTLTANIEPVTGTAFIDTFAGTIGAGANTGTFAAGDQVLGGAGSDTLNLRVLPGAGGAIVGTTTVESVETVNIGLVTAAANTFDASSWSGVASLTNFDSRTGAILQVSGLEASTIITLYGDSELNVGYRNFAATAVSLNLVNAGDFDLSGAVTNRANLDLDNENAGLLSSVTLNLSGSSGNAVELDDAGGALAVTVNGSGTAVFVMDVRATAVSFSGFAAVSATFNTTGAVRATMGSGDSTITRGLSFTSGDFFDGGEGTDSLAISTDGFSKSLGASGVEAITITYSELVAGALNVANAGTAQLSFVAGTANNEASITEVAGGGTAVFADTDIGNVTLDFRSGAASVVMRIGSASGAVTLDTVTITDVAAVTIVSDGSGNAAATGIGTLVLDSDLRSLTIMASGGEADLVIGSAAANISLGGATSLVVTTNGSAAIDLASALGVSGSALSMVSVVTNGTTAASAEVGSITGPLSVLSLNASGAEITVGNVTRQATATAFSADIVSRVGTATVGNITIDFATGSFTATVNVSMAAASRIDIGAIDAEATGSGFAASLVLGAVSVLSSGTAEIAGIVMSSAKEGATLSLGSISVLSSGKYSAGLIDFTNVTGAVGAIAISVSGSGAFANLGAGGTAINASAGSVGDISITANVGSADFGAVQAARIGSITVVAGQSGDVDLSSFSAASSIGAISLSASGSGSVVDIGVVQASSVSAIDVVAGASSLVTVGDVSGSSIGSIQVTVGTAGSADFGVLAASGGNIGAMNIAVASGGVFDLGNVSAGGSIGALSVALGVGSATFGAMNAAGSIGAKVISIVSSGDINFGAQDANVIGAMSISLGTGASADFGTIEGSASIGAISISVVSGSDFSATKLSAGIVGSIAIDAADGALVTFSDIDGSAAGSIFASGVGDVSLDVNTDLVGVIDARNMGGSGAFTIDLAGISAAATVRLGSAVNVVVSGPTGDSITLLTGSTAVTGADTIRFNTGQATGDAIANFIAGSGVGGDVISLNRATIARLRDGVGSAIGAGVVDILIATGPTAAANDNILVLNTALTVAGVTGFMVSSYTFGTAVAGSGNLVVVWSDSTSSYVSLVAFSAAGGDTTLASASASVTLTNLAILQGVTASALTSANFTFV